MLELGGNLSEAADLVKDVDEKSFMTDVVEESQKQPVIVDFWADWCGPCKTLGPMLEKAVRGMRGAVKMAKVDVDKNQMIAAQLQVQSLPTVYAFHKGRPLDGFQGALPESEIQRFLKRVVDAAGGDASGGLDEAIASAEEMLAEGALADAAQTFAAILRESPENAEAYGGLVRAYIALGDLDQAEAILNGASEEISASPALEAAHAQLVLARQAANSGPVGELEAKLSSNPDDHQARLDLSRALHAKGEAEAAVEQLLELYRRDPDWNEGAAKTQLFTIFDALKPDDPIVKKGRRKLTSMMFV